jgi:hypothetical protein
MSNIKKLHIGLIVTICILISISVIIYALFFREESKPEIINLRFDLITFKEDSNEAGTYLGTVIADTNMEVSDIVMLLIDISLERDNRSNSMYLQDGRTLEVLDSNDTFDLNCTYFDKNKNNILDKNDEFILKNVESGDSIRLNHIPTASSLPTFMHDFE